VFDEGAGVSTATQQYDPIPIINELRHRVNIAVKVINHLGDEVMRVFRVV
jgi:hypothetical protein